MPLCRVSDCLRVASATCLSLCCVSLGGYPPFHEGFGNASVSEQIVHGEFTMVPSKWRHVSDQGSAHTPSSWGGPCLTGAFCVEAKDVVRKLLVVDPSQRMSIGEALHHPWLQVRHPTAAA